MTRLAKLDKRLALAALLLLASVVLLDVLTQSHLKDKHILEQRDALFLKLGSLRHQVEKELTANLLLIQGTANFIAVSDELTDERFNRYAEEALKGNSQLKNLVAAPDFVIRHVYPLKGNESVLGKNYKDLPSQWGLVQKAYETGSLVVAGPVNLIQGGTGLIGRAPVFTRQGNEKKFWGIVSGVIDMDRLLKNITATSQSADITIAIRGRDGKGLSGDVFLGDESLFTAEEHSVFMPVVFPTGSWVIAAMPHNGWDRTPPLSWMFHLVYLLMGVGITLSVSNTLTRNMALEDTQEMLNEAQNMARLGNWKLDTQTGIFWWSKEFYAILGVDESITRPTLELFFERIHPDDRETVRAAYEKFLATGESRGFDCRIVRPDESIRHIHAANARLNREGGQAIAFGTIQDITARKAMEDALVAEQHKFKAMADASYDAFIMIDSNDTILFWSAAAERLFGWTAEEALGQKVHRLIVPPKYLDAAMQGMERFKRTGTGMVMNSVMEFRALRKDGTSFPVERSVSSFSIGDEHYAVGHIRDITERKLAELKLERMATTDSLTGLTNRARFLEIAA
ncbi:MAG: PAS domain S-box protein, partial [Halodesulfovibrio sp.]